MSQESMYNQEFPPPIDELATIESSESASHDISSEVRAIYVEAMCTGIRQPENVNEPAENYMSQELGLIQFALENPDGTLRQIDVGQTAKIIKDSESGPIKLWYKTDQINTVKPEILLSETVVTSIDENDETTFAGSVLTLTNKERNTSVSLNKLLPYGCKFIPSEMENSSIDSYNGSEDSTENSISFNDIEKTVTYSNLSTNHDMFGMLHEVAHAWQAEYHGDAFENYHHVNGIVDNAQSAKMYAEELVRSKQSDYVPTEEMAQIFHTLNISSDQRESFMNSALQIAVDRLKRSGVVFGEGKVLECKDLTLSEKVKDYVWAERQAWASALKTFSALEKEGLLPEPYDKDAARKEVHKQLSTYQKGLEVLNIKYDKGFTIQENEDGD